jgi:hypothetical protein
MPLFEFVLTLMSFVLALGITNNLREATQLDFSSRAGLVSLAWLGSITVLQIDFWILMWMFRDRGSWHLYEIFTLLSSVMTLYVAGALVARKPLDTINQAQVAYRPTMVAIATWLFIVSLTSNFSGLLHVSLFGQTNIAIGLGFIVLILGWWQKPVWGQTAIALTFFVWSVAFLLIGVTELTK